MSEVPRGSGHAQGGGPLRWYVLDDGELKLCDEYGPIARCPCEVHGWTDEPGDAPHGWTDRGGWYWCNAGPEGAWHQHARPLIHIDVVRERGRPTG